MTDFGIYTGMMQTTLQPIDLARAVEERGFDSLAFGEHSHVPAGVVLPASEVSGEWFASQYDPFVALGAAAAVTTTLRLGTAVTLIPRTPRCLRSGAGCWNSGKAAERGERRPADSQAEPLLRSEWFQTY
ncbi:MAG: LLM class flavin-dependent oxidoreductase [Dehalococcoidia bacterium]|nr:LLM class flavin-dependent oxidoreductase [Dehalococcoidia bacterium]